MHPIIALWSHPRSMSTAMERVMRERGDLHCFHEPFMYDYYINRKVREMPHFEAKVGHPVSYTEVRDTLLHQAETGPVFLKDMSYYVMPHIVQDLAISERLVNCFVIRNPVASIPSYFKLDPGVTCEEIGLEAQARHYLALRDAGKPAVIIQAEDVRQDAVKIIGALWAAIGLPPADYAFEWQSERPKDWDQVEGWHKDVSASKGIRPITAAERQAQREKFDALAQSQPKAQRYLDHHLPHYELLRQNALTA